MAEQAARPAFRPSRGRASMSAVPGSTSLNKENGASTSALLNNNNESPNNKRKKRAHSLGGEALEQATKRAKELAELSPSKKARRSLAPRRSILKAVPAIFEGTGDLTATFNIRDAALASSYTTDLSSLSTFNRRRSSLRSSTLPGAQDDDDDEESDSDDENGTMDMDITRMEQTRDMDDRRKSLMSRRVSFAPNAHIRTFTPDKPTAQAQALAHAQQQAQLAAAAAEMSSSEEDSDEDDEEDSEPSMEIAADEVTRAFAGHFAGTTVPASAFDDPNDEDEQEDEEDSDDEGSSDMDVANTGEITSAFASQKTGVFNSGISQPPAVAPAPAPSALRPETSVAPVDKGKSRVSVMFGGVPSSDDEDATMDIDEDADTADHTGAMDMTSAVGGLITVGGAPSQGLTVEEVVSAVEETVVAEEEDEEEDDDDESAAGEMSMAEQTVDMMDATSYGGILSVATPSTPSARLQAQLFARQLGDGTLPANASPVRSSPRRLVNPTPERQNTATFKSPARPPAPIFAPKSPIVPPKSPRALELKSPARRAASPRKSLVGAPSPARQPVVSAAAVATPPRPVSPIKRSTTPTLAATTPRATFTPKVLPPVSAGRSPGGSLSLRGLLQEQLNRTAASPKSPRAAPPSSLASPKRAGKGTWDSPKSVSRLSELKGVALTEDDNTESSFGGYLDEEEGPAPNLSLSQFLEATGTGFVNDVLGMTGVDLHNKRRKSMAPGAIGRKTSGPPSFADLAVAGGCQSLFHQLYHSDHIRLQEDLSNTIATLDDCEEALLHEDQPKIFNEWSLANEAHRAIMQSQFRMIKAHYYLDGRVSWNQTRSTNYDLVNKIMEENLEGLKADNAMIEQTSFAPVIPDLKARHAALLAELHEERQRDLELSACDQEELSSMHEAIEEQAAELRKLEAGYSQVADELARISSRAEDEAAKLARSRSEKDDLQRKLEEGRCFTKAEVFRLQAEFDALQHLNGWTLVKFDKVHVELRHLDDFNVRLDLGHGRVDRATFELSPSHPLTTLEADVTRFLFDKVVANVQWLLSDSDADGQCRRAKSIIQRIDSLWTSARRLRRELVLTHHRFPTSAHLVNESLLQVQSEIHVPSARATFFVTLELTGEELVTEDERKPAELDSVIAQVGSDIVVKFGQIDVESLKYIIRERLDGGGRGALLDACREVEMKV